MRASSSASRVRVGSTVNIAGLVRPSLPGHTVYLQRQVAARKWQSIQHRKLNRNSRFRFVVRHRRTGTFTYRVLSPRVGRRVTAGASARMKVTVRPKPRAAACTPGYSPCIPPGPDVDCAGGSGNGPRYVTGPIRVTGSDPYGLDSDGDGWGCES